MDTQTEAQIYLSDQRGHSEVDFFRSYHEFNFGRYVADSREPFGPLQVLNDNTLQAGRSISMTVEQNTEVIILPIVGGLAYRTSLGAGFLEAGQAQVFGLAAGMTYEISNPYETELINYVEIWLTSDATHFEPKINQIEFDLSTQNKLVLFAARTQHYVTDEASFQAYIGRYDGRAEEIYQLKSAANGAFVFVLSGAFEAQNRLLHERDGLALSTLQNQQIDFEALSNNAILLLLEIPMNPVIA
ncbi:hypothetical protein GCM10028807_17100 [Spirosoma daeguense]